MHQFWLVIWNNSCYWAMLFYANGLAPTTIFYVQKWLSIKTHKIKFYLNLGSGIRLCSFWVLKNWRKKQNYSPSIGDIKSMTCSETFPIVKLFEPMRSNVSKHPVFTIITLIYPFYYSRIYPLVQLLFDYTIWQVIFRYAYPALVVIYMICLLLILIQSRIWLWCNLPCTNK